MTFDIEFDIDSVKVNQYANYLGQKSLSSKAIVWTHTTPVRLLYLDHFVVDEKNSSVEMKRTQ